MLAGYTNHRQECFIPCPAFRDDLNQESAATVVAVQKRKWTRAFSKEAQHAAMPACADASGKLKRAAPDAGPFLAAKEFIGVALVGRRFRVQTSSIAYVSLRFRHGMSLCGRYIL